MRFVIAALLVLAACAPPVEPGKTKVILGATLLQAGSAPVSPSAIVVSGTRVLRVGTQAETPIPAGSEKVAAWGKFVIAEPVTGPGPGIVQVVEKLKQAGRPPDEIIAAITVDPARKDDSGSLKAGRTANLWILGANPIDNPSALAAPERILKEGQWKN